MLCLIEIVLKRGGIFRFDIYGRKLFIYGRAVFNILYLLFCGKIRLFIVVVIYVNS